MTTLGALLVGLLLLVLLLGVLAWMQRRPRRGPTQPRTVADLVRMREAVRPSADETEVDAPEEAAEERESEPVEVPEAPVAVAEPVRVEETVDRVRERPDEREVRQARVPVSPEDAAVEAPWARAARMVEPGEYASEEPRPVVNAAAAAGLRRPSLALVPSVDGDARARSARHTRPASLQRPSTAGSATAEPPVSPQAHSNGVAERPAASTAAPTRQASAPPPASAAPVEAAAVPAVEPAAPTDAATVPAVGSAARIDAPPPAYAAPAVPVDTSVASPAPSGAAPAEGTDGSGAPTEPRRENVDRPGAAADPSAVHSDSGAGVKDVPIAPAEQTVDTAEIAAERGSDADATTELAARRAEVVERAHRPEVTAPADDAPTVDVPDESRASASPVTGDRASANGAATVRPDIAEATNGHALTPTHARVAGRVRRRPSATPAEQEAADLALLRTFGVAHRNGADEPDVALEGCAPDDDAPPAGNAQPISVRVLGRDGQGIRGATVTLLDDHGRETANTRTNADGHCVLTARHPGGYMLVTAADGFQPGAITVAVTDEPVDAELPLTRSATISGTGGGEDGPLAGARLALVQDGEIVDATESAADGTYRFADLAAGEYGLSVTAHECEAVAFVLELADEADLRQDVELGPAGLPSDDVVTAPR